MEVSDDHACWSQPIHLPAHQAGIRARNDDLPQLKFVAMGSCEHDMQLIDLALMLKRHTGSRFVTERRIRQERGLAGIGVQGHVPAGLLELHGQEPTAAELELSTKVWRRLKGIMADYAADLDIGDVWYFAGSDALHRRLQRAADGYNFVRVHSLPVSTSVV